MATSASTLSTNPKKKSFFSKLLDGIAKVVEWPIEHARMLAEFIGDAKKDYPVTQAAIVKTVALVEGLGPDLLDCLASKGLNFEADAKAEQNVVALFAYIKETLLPAIQTDYADFKNDQAALAGATPPADPDTTAAAEVANAPAATGAPVPAPDPAAGAGPQVHTQTPA